MKGLYLYCVRNKGGKNIRAHGIDGGANVFTIPYKEIEAVVSGVDLKKMNSREVSQRAREDIDWIIKHATKHEKVIESAMGNSGLKAKSHRLNAVVPMKFGTIFEKPQNLEDTLRKEYQKFRKLLTNLTGKQEWGVKVYAKESVLKEKLKSSEKKVQTQIKRAKSLPRGTDYFGELEVKKELGNIMQKKMSELSKKFFKILSSFALESRQNKILAGEFAGHAELMVLNSAYLVPEDQVDKLILETKNLQKLNPEFIFEYTGPWPAYNFI
jgi:hypothetical protein